MRYLLIALLLLPGVCFANVNATIKGFSIDTQNIIWANVEYDIDGEIVTNPYPIQKSNLVGRSAEQIESWLSVNIIYQCDVYTGVKFKEKDKEKNLSGYVVDDDYYKDEYHNKVYTGEPIKETDEKEFTRNILSPLIGKIFMRTNAPLVKKTGEWVGEEFVVTKTEKAEVKSDGTYKIK